MASDDEAAAADILDEEQPPTGPLRQPIVAVLGHVDHGKTSLLDWVRGTAVVSREAGAITQHIGATEVPFETISDICGALLPEENIRLPGLLFIDTPGHHSFSTLRARGGQLADLAVLVVDIMEGFKPQTIESLQVLRRAQTPFILVLNKIDRLPGWRTRKGTFAANRQGQSQLAQDALQERIWEIVRTLGGHNFDSALYSEVEDFQKTIALVPTSVRDSGEGVPELFMLLMGLAQRYLEGRLVLKEGVAEGTVLEVKEERGLGKTLGIIIYNGVLRASDTLIIGATPEPLVTRVRSLLQPRPLDEIRDPRQQFNVVTEVAAAAGLKVVAPDLEGVIAGAPFYGVPQGDDIAPVLERLSGEMESNVALEDRGLVVRADAIGSLEALAYELQEAGAPIMRAAVGDVSRRDVRLAETAPAEQRAVLAFGVNVLPDAREALVESEAKLFEADVVYQLVEEYGEWLAELKREQARTLREEFPHPGKIEFLEGHTFRTRDPAVFGVRVLAGRIMVGQKVLRADNHVIGRIRSMRSGEQGLKEATQGDEVAIAVTEATVGRQVNEGDILYIEMDERDVVRLRDENVKLTPDEEDVITELQRIKKADSPFWGR
ncbi:MAG: translation initiation factor IF-2 [Candidatus Poseidoniia archaeon]|jgi:translation initiation factor 5B|nr:translation initiation factor IF-2 [Candidatus Poseidoniia archaeon]MDP7535209.1 translation initiation factor IF-2 [Candidatus Poseidoniia archaeon]MDP7607028.1 translation initiation factor IF-2 [Candidatus Poseidoniia archaeon]HJP44286.1 translation initiation factor IF-2 [Candidatus Poseidoniia archaeon]